MTEPPTGLGNCHPLITPPMQVVTASLLSVLERTRDDWTEPVGLMIQSITTLPSRPGDFISSRS